MGGEPGDAVTMIEFARDASGVMPRMFAVNHHPEIVDRFRQVMILDQKRDRGEVTDEWYRERLEILTRAVPRGGRRPAAAPHLGLHAPRAAALPPVPRSCGSGPQSLALPFGLHEDRVIHAVLGEPVGAGRAAEVF